MMKIDFCFILSEEIFELITGINTLHRYQYASTYTRSCDWFSPGGGAGGYIRNRLVFMPLCRGQ